MTEINLSKDASTKELIAAIDMIIDAQDNGMSVLVVNDNETQGTFYKNATDLKVTANVLGMEVDIVALRRKVLKDVLATNKAIRATRGFYGADGLTFDSGISVDPRFEIIEIPEEKMTPQEAAKILRYHNEWRRYNGPIGLGPEMTSPKTLGEAIDTVCDAIEKGPTWEDMKLVIAAEGSIYDEHHGNSHEVLEAYPTEEVFYGEVLKRYNRLKADG